MNWLWAHWDVASWAKTLCRMHVYRTTERLNCLVVEVFQCMHSGSVVVAVWWQRRAEAYPNAGAVRQKPKLCMRIGMEGSSARRMWQ